MKMTTKEHLVYFMQTGMMKLSNYDIHFVQNLNHLILAKKPITSNQVELFEKLIQKYQRQFQKHKLSVNILETLPWTITIIKSTPEFTEAHISIIDNKIYFKSPFNKKFIKEFRDYELNPFNWDRENRRYESNFNTYSLKILYDTAKKHYPTINYCPVTMFLLNKVHIEFTSDLIYEPTLVHKNGRLFVGAINESLYEAIKDIDLTYDARTINELSSYGIKISSELARDEKIKFAGSCFYEVESKDLLTIIDWLKEFDCDCVFFYGLVSANIKSEMYDKLDSLGIHHYNINDLLFRKNKFVNQYKNIYYIHFTTTRTNLNSLSNQINIRKIIKVHNSYPIILNQK